MRLLLLNPNTSQEMTDAMAATARAEAAPTTEIVTATGRFGPKLIVTRAETAIASHAALDALARNVHGCDVVMVAGFGDYGLPAIRQLSPVPVVGLAESSMMTASQLGARFGFVVIGSSIVPILRELAILYGLSTRYAGTRVAEHEELGGSPDPKQYAAEIVAVARGLIDEEGAEAIILGGPAMPAVKDLVADRLAVPVVEGIQCAVRQAEALGGLGVQKAAAGSYGAPGARDLIDVGEDLVDLFAAGAAKED